MAARGTSQVTFGRFHVDTRTGELWRGGRSLRLQGLPFRVLTVLLETPGDVVTREELRARLWPADTYVDFEHGLNTAIKKLRRALGDSAEKPRYVETLPRRGYRFIAEIDPVVGHPVEAFPGVSGDERPVPEAGRFRGSLGTGTWALALALTILVVSTFGLAPWHAGPSAGDGDGDGDGDGASVPHTSTVRSIGVLPFTAIGDPDGEAYLTVGIADAIITRLGRIQHVVVPPTSAVLSYTNPGQDRSEIGRKLGVDAVVDGRIQRDGERLRVTIQLLRVEDGATLWADAFEERFSDSFSVQDSIAVRVAESLGPRLEREERRRPTRRRRGRA